MTFRYVDLILIVFGGWLLFLTVYVWQKSRLLFRRQSDLSQSAQRQKVEAIGPLHLEVQKHSRLLEIQGKKRISTREYILPRFTAQFGEDLVLFDFFRESEPGFFVEAGAYDGVTFSNTYLLESVGWKGLLVEPNPSMAEICRRQRPNAIVEQAALGPDGCARRVDFTAASDPRGGAPLSFVHASANHIERCRAEHCRFETYQVALVSLNSLLDSRTDRVDFLSLDVEGMEIEALRGFDLGRFRPRVLLVELQRDDRDIQVQGHLSQSGYQPAGVIGCNCFYASVDDVVLLSELIHRVLDQQGICQKR